MRVRFHAIFRMMGFDISEVKRQNDLEEAKKNNNGGKGDRCSLHKSSLKISSSLPDDNTQFAIHSR